MKTFVAPADPTLSSTGMSQAGVAGCSYRSNGQVFGDNYYGGNAGGKARLGPWFTDGTSNTLAFAESYSYYPSYGTWISWPYDVSSGYCSYYYDYTPCWGTYINAYPQFNVTPTGSNPAYPDYVQGFGAYGILVSMCDGSVRTVTPGVSQSAWSAAMTPQGGEVIDSSW